MSLPAPDENRIGVLAAHFGFDLDAAGTAAFASAVGGTLAASDEVARLYTASRPPVPERTWNTPTDDPLGAWAVRTTIEGRGGGPLAGRTVAVKDNVAVAGVPMVNGTRVLEGFVPRRDATVVQRVLAAGATITGKSTCEALCFSGASFTSWPAPVRNPWDLTRSAGGSSSGNGALIASGQVDLGIGGDQGGSVRIPAAFCGIVGHKPTHGLVPYTGAFPIENTIDHLGPMARTVSDVALLLDVLAGADGFDHRQPGHLDPVGATAGLGGDVRGLTVGILREGFGTAVSDGRVDAAVRGAAEGLRALGVEVVEVSVPWHTDAMAVWNVIATEGAARQMVEGTGYGMNTWGQYDPELVEFYGRRLTERANDLSETVKLVAMSGRYTFEEGHGSYYAMARNLAYDVRAAYDRVLGDVDLLVLPTLPYVADELPPADVDLPGYLGAALSMIGNVAPFDVSGHPAVSVPAPAVDGLPVGMMLVGRRFADAQVLQVAHAYEMSVGGFPSPPPLAATVPVLAR